VFFFWKWITLFWDLLYVDRWRGTGCTSFSSKRTFQLKRETKPNEFVKIARATEWTYNVDHVELAGILLNSVRYSSTLWWSRIQRSCRWGRRWAGCITCAGVCEPLAGLSHARNTTKAHPGVRVVRWAVDKLALDDALLDEPRKVHEQLRIRWKRWHNRKRKFYNLNINF